MQAAGHGIPVSSLTRTEDGQEKPYGWILNPSVDILFCCGGILWLAALVMFCLLLQNPDSGGEIGRRLITINAILAIFLANPHAPATLHRVYFDKSVPRSLIRLSNVAGLCLLALFFVAIRSAPLTLFLFKVYFYWLAQHYLAQSFGITLIYCYKRNYMLKKWERDTLAWLHNAILLYLVISTCTFRSPGGDAMFKGLYGYAPLFWGPLPLWIYWSSLTFLVLMAIGWILIVVRKFIKEGEVFPLPAALLVISSFAMYAFAWYNTAFTYFLPVWWHGSQYLVVTSALYLKQKGLPVGVSYSQIAKQLKTWAYVNYYLLLVGVGFFIWFIFAPCVALFGIPFGIVIMALQSNYSFHHFMLDAGIWKLRDPKLRKMMVA